MSTMGVFLIGQFAWKSTGKPLLRLVPCPMRMGNPATFFQKDTLLIRTSGLPDNSQVDTMQGTLLDPNRSLLISMISKGSSEAPFFFFQSVSL